jgi:hypothetical protein
MQLETRKRRGRRRYRHPYGSAKDVTGQRTHHDQIQPVLSALALIYQLESKGGLKGGNVRADHIFTGTVAYGRPSGADAFWDISFVERTNEGCVERLTLKLSTSTLPFSLFTTRSGTLSETMMMPPWIPSCVLSSTDDRGESQVTDEYTTEHSEDYAKYRAVVACCGVCGF